MFRWIARSLCALSGALILAGCPQAPDSPSSIGNPYPSLERAVGIYSTADGGFIVMGHRTQSPYFNFRQQLFLSKRNANGREEWSSHFTAPMLNTTPMSMTGKAVKETPDGDIVVAS